VGEDNADSLATLVDAGKARGIEILPVITPAGMDLDKDSPQELYGKSRKLAIALGKRFKDDIRVWELGNEMETYAIIKPCEKRDDGTQYPCAWGPAGGTGALDYYGPRWVKVSAVLLRCVNDDEASDLLAWAIAHEYELRFIEQMPLDAQHDWHRDQMVTADEIFERLGRDFTLTPASEPRGSSPAELFLVDGGPATVGVIASVTRPFCGDCDRVRLTADGQVRNCLFAREESDLRSPLRAGASDEELADRWLTAMASKLPGHGINDPTFLQPDRPMSAIGG